LKTLKIVITGTYAAGKTSFIRAISEIDPVDTEAVTTLAAEQALKQHTTVALDFGIITVSDEVMLYLFGTPGQDRFDFMWEILSEGCIGYVVLIDSCRPAHFAEACLLIERFATITSAPFVVAASKQDDPAALPVSYMRRRLGLPASVPIIPCTTMEKESVKQVLLHLLDHIMLSAPASLAAVEEADESENADLLSGKA
jgi:uncharacterized protein